jgi:tRNA(fMet)-specific endonuclease VapC
LTYLLDANICIDHFRKRSTRALERALLRVGPAEMSLCSVVVAELLAGCYGAQNPAAETAKVQRLRALFRSLPMDDAAAEVAAGVYGELSARGERIGGNDLFIAGIALSNDLTLVTHNVREFGRVPGLRIEDWQALP